MLASYKLTDSAAASCSSTAKAQESVAIVPNYSAPKLIYKLSAVFCNPPALFLGVFPYTSLSLPRPTKRG